ncbi:MAG: hypothetical protein LC772_03385, partial [Chloroflexi bacterium]|nr:hypothetical protein [Chloroflexota bacterium]
AEHHSNQVGRLRQSNGGWFYDGFAVSTPQSEMDSIAVDRINHRVWVTENAGNKIVRLETSVFPPAVTEINAVTTANLNPVPGDVRVGSSGVPWITEGYEGGNVAGQIARIDPATNSITSYRPRTNTSGFDGINFDGLGGVWFVELTDNKVGRFANGQFTEWNLPRSNVTPTNIVVDGTGKVWVTEQSGNAIAELNPDTGAWQEFPVPTASSLPSGIALDPSGNIWFTEFQSGKIGLLSAGSTTAVDFPIPTPDSGPEDVIATADGHIYFTEQYGNKVGEIIASTQARSVGRSLTRSPALRR